VSLSLLFFRDVYVTASAISILNKSSRLTLGNRGHSSTEPLPILRDLDQPFPFNIRMYNRPYRFNFYDTSSPENFTLLRPALVILCYSIASPESLTSVHKYWKTLVETHFNDSDTLPVVLLGLKRDVRSQEDYGGSVKPAIDGTVSEDQQPINGRKFVYPQEGLAMAQKLRCDKYCECSAVTGEASAILSTKNSFSGLIISQLCREVFEDIAKTAAMTTTSRGGRADEPPCSVM
jgi:Ras family protein A